jgi:hypothetical protein
MLNVHSSVKLPNLLHINKYEISAPQYQIHYSPAENCDVLDIVVHNNVRLWEVTVFDILDSNHLPIVFHLQVLIRTRNFSDPVYKIAVWKRTQSLASKLILFIIQINSEKVADKAARVFSASIASTYRLSPSKITLSDIN